MVELRARQSIIIVARLFTKNLVTLIACLVYNNQNGENTWKVTVHNHKLNKAD